MRPVDDADCTHFCNPLKRDRGKQIFKCNNIDWLDEMTVDTRVFRPTAILFLSPSGNRNNRNMIAGPITTTEEALC